MNFYRDCEDTCIDCRIGRKHCDPSGVLRTIRLPLCEEEDQLALVVVVTQEGLEVYCRRVLLPPINNVSEDPHLSRS